MQQVARCPDPVITFDDKHVEKHTELHKHRAVLTSSCQLDADIAHIISKASESFGRLKTRVWQSHNISIKANMDLFYSVVLSNHLYGGEVWTLYAR